MRLTYQQDARGQGKTSDNTDEVDVRFSTLITDKQIEQTATFVSDDPDFFGVMQMIWTLLPVENETLVTVRAEDVRHGIKQDDHEAAMYATLDNLAAYLRDSL